MALDQGDISIVAKFHALSCYATKLLTSEKERNHLYIKGLNYDLQVLSVH